MAQPGGNLCGAVVQVQQELSAEPCGGSEVSLAAVSSLATRLHSPAWDAGSGDMHGSTELGGSQSPTLGSRNGRLAKARGMEVV